MNPIFLLGILGGAGALAFTLIKHQRDARGHDEGRVPIAPARQNRRTEMEDPGTGIRRDHEAIADDINGEPGPLIPTMGDWSRVLAPLCLEAGVPLPFVLKWIETESAGNACAVGDTSAHGVCGRGSETCPDPRFGNFPREIGIAQLYNAKDFQDLNLNPADFRAYCGPSQDGKFSQVVTRPLTPREIEQQAKAAVEKIQIDQRSATRKLRDVNAGPSWAPDRQDFWRFVKLQHGLPGLANAMPAITRKLGRAPRDWSEFRQTIAVVKLDPGTERFRKKFPRILNNAEKTAAAVVERSMV